MSDFAFLDGVETVAPNMEYFTGGMSMGIMNVFD